MPHAVEPTKDSLDVVKKNLAERRPYCSMYARKTNGTTAISRTRSSRSARLKRGPLPTISRRSPVKIQSFICTVLLVQGHWKPPSVWRYWPRLAVAETWLQRSGESRFFQRQSPDRQAVSGLYAMENSRRNSVSTSAFTFLTLAHLHPNVPFEHGHLDGVVHDQAREHRITEDCQRLPPR